MAYPVPVVEIAFSDGPYVVSPTWTDVTAYVTDLSTSRGRDNDWGRFTGTAQVTLLNNDRRFDPFYTSGPYYGNLKPRRQIRIRSTWNGNTYDVFRGFIQGWPPAWTDAGKMSTVTLSCFDALDLLGSSTVPADWSDPVIASTSPVHWWKCTEPISPYASSNVIADFGSSPMPLTLSATAINGSELAPGLASASLDVTSSEEVYGPNWIANKSFTIGGWWKPSSGAVSSAYGIYGRFFGCQMWIMLANNSIRARANFLQALPTEYVTTTVSEGYTSGESYLVHATFNVATFDLNLYVNGVAVATTKTTVAGSSNSPSDRLGLSPGTYQHLCVWDRIISLSEMQSIYKASAADFPETTSARVARLIAQTSFPTALVSTPASPVGGVLGIGNDAANIREELQITADTEYGPLFVSRNGTITMFSQTQTQTQSSSLVSASTFGAGGQPIGPNVQVQYDGDSVRNVANVGYMDNATYTTTNTSSVSTYGQSDEYVQTYAQTYGLAQQIGNIVSGFGGQVYPDADEVEVVMSPAGTWSSVLNLELCDRFTLAVQPPTGNAITVPMLLGKVRHEAQPGRWRSFVTGSARWAAVFILDQSKLDSTDLLG